MVEEALWGWKPRFSPPYFSWHRFCCFQIAPLRENSLPRVGGAWPFPFADESMKDYEKFSHGQGQKFASRMIRVPLILLSLLLLVASPVSSTETLDMIFNPKIYSYPPYSFKGHFCQSLQVRVIGDNRPGYERTGKYRPDNHMKESSWAEPIPVMVEKVLEREFLLSNLFDSVTRHDNRSSLILEIDLNSFSAAWMPGRSGLKPIFTIYGGVDLNASLISRKEGRILLIKNYREEVHAEITQFRNKEGYAAIEVGKAMKRVTASLMRDIKGRIDRLEEEILAEKRNSTRAKKRPPKKQRGTGKPKTETVHRKESTHISLEPIGPK